MYVIVWLCLPLVVTSREYLNPNRAPDWDISNSNIGPSYAQPEQVHLSLSDDPTELVVTWLTWNDTQSSEVNWGPMTDYLQWSNKASVTKFQPQNNPPRFIHRAVMTKLKPDVQYLYRVGSIYGWSNMFKFRSIDENKEGGIRFAVYGDMGVENAQSLGRVQAEAQVEQIDAVLHVGDMGYNLNDVGPPFMVHSLQYNGKTGDLFMNNIMPIAGYVPYMVAVGNHESGVNFTHYMNYFTMPKTEHNLYYSFDIGKAHIISFSTEIYYYTNDYSLNHVKWQYEWLEADLKKANENRKKRPWIITMGHRPMYCSTRDADDCTHDEAITRVGVNHKYGLEQLFYKYGVDIELWAHEHTYERLFPVFDRIVHNGTADPYEDPPAPVHLLSGSAGCKEYTDQFNKPRVWDAYRSTNYGYAKMQVFNDTHVFWEQIRASTGEPEDHIWIVKNKHAPYNKHDMRLLKTYGTYVPYSNEEELHLRSNRIDNDL